MIARPIERKVTLWLCSLAALTAFNVGLWIWIARSASLRSPYADDPAPAVRRVRRRMRFPLAVPACRSRTGVSVGHVALRHHARPDRGHHRRAVFRAAVQLLRAEAGGHHRHAVAGGRQHTRSCRWPSLAQLLCWYAVLSLNHFGHAVEESLWALMMLILSAASGAAAFVSDGPLRTVLIVGCLVYGSRCRPDDGRRRADVRPPLAAAGRGHPPDPRDGTARQPASPAADARRGRSGAKRRPG